MEDYFAEKESTEIDDTEALEAALAEERAKAESCLENWKRAQADFINYKRRQEQDREEASKSANAMLILGLLPVLDDLKRAMESVPPRLAKTPWVDGIRLIERKFLAILEAEGLSRIKAQGEPFDPNLHEATMHTEGEEGMVIKELQTGYRLHDRVLRPVMVAVGNGHKTEKTDD